MASEGPKDPAEALAEIPEIARQVWAAPAAGELPLETQRYGVRLCRETLELVDAAAKLYGWTQAVNLVGAHLDAADREIDRQEIERGK